MANIMITDACNLKCSYCFANEFVNINRNEITEEAFLKAVDFIVSDGTEKIVGIIGGEPTLHPKFDCFMKSLILDERVRGIMLYTNGLLLNRHWNVCSHAKTHLLINCNSPADIGAKNYSVLCKNLHILFEEKLCKDRVTLGINMYSPDFEYDYIIEFLKKFGIHHLRVSITVPNMDENRNVDAHDYFYCMKPRVIEFFHVLLKNDIIPNFDCNKLPSCIISDAELSLFNVYFSHPFIKENISKSNISNRYVNCNPVIDIRQDLTAVRCFGLSQWTKQKISDFKGIRDLKNYYIRTIDAYSYNCVYSDKCSNCYERKVLSCNGGCLAFKSNAIKSLASIADAQNQKYTKQD